MPSIGEPLLLSPHLASRVWGGDRLGAGIGEAWDCSVHPHGPSTVVAGPHAGRTLAELASAEPAAFGGPVSLLAKRLDCAQVLSVQVHPREGDPKTEAWVVLEAEPGAGVYHGLRAPAPRAELEAAARDGSLPELMRFVEVRPGDAIFVPSGTLHAIGAGLLLFELQQSADTTFRLFDWGRGRELHLEQGLDCLDPDSYDPSPPPRALDDGATRLVECEHFFIDRIDGAGAATLDPGGRWCAVLVLEGRARVGPHELGPGGTVLVPAGAGSRELEPAGGSLRALRYGPPARA